MIRVLLCLSSLLYACSGPQGTALATPVWTPDQTVQPTVLPTPHANRASRIDIGRLAVSLQLASSSQIDALPDATAFVMEGTAWPCDQGTSFVYAHARPDAFLSLWGALVDDEIGFTASVDGGNILVCSYRVTGTFRVSASDVSWYSYRGSTDRTLVLQTSLGPNPSYGEFIVVAEGSN